MGRPIQKKYFANTNSRTFGTANVGGESVASVAISGVWSGYTQATSTVTFSAPDLVGGVQAEGTVTITAGEPTAVTITVPGSGYLTAPTVTIADSDGGAETAGTATALLTSGASARQNSIKCEAQIGSGTEVTTGDIIAQKGTRKYRVQTGDGTATCTLVASADLSTNEMSITAVDANTNAYWVTKLTAHRAILTRKVSGSGDFASGASVPWGFAAASSGIVQIENQ